MSNASPQATPQTTQKPSTASAQEKVSAWKRIQEHVEKILLKAWAGTIINVALVLVGVWATLYYKEIQATLPFTFPAPGAVVDWPAIIFWIGLVSSSFAFGMRQRGIDRGQSELRGALKNLKEAADQSAQDLRSATDHFAENQKELQEQLNVGVKGLSEAINTMPSQKYLDTQADIIDNCESLVWGVRGGPSDAIIRAIRTILLVVAQLASAFDESKDDIEYAANIMIRFMMPRRSPSVIKSKFSIAQKMLRFATSETSVVRLDSILVLRQDLSATTKRARPLVTNALSCPEDEDRSMPALALGIPRKFYADIQGPEIRRLRVLPGAPTATLMKRPDYCPDAQKLYSMCEEEREIDRDVLNALHRYFNDGQGKEVRSFISIPLVAPQDANIGQSVFAVINIHSNCAGMLTNGMAVQLFLTSTRPLTRMLVRLLLELRKLEGAKPDKQEGVEPERYGWWKVQPDTLSS